jgi:hypothetical protein
MAYSSVYDMVDALAAFLDETPVGTFNLTANRRSRLTHYVQRALDDIWNDRPWPFKFADAGPLTATDNVISLATVTDFGSIGEEGIFWDDSDNDKRPWAEIAIQDLKSMLARGNYENERVFALGWGSGQELYVPRNGTNVGAFMLTYKREIPTVSESQGVAVPIPGVLHAALFQGAVARLQQAKGDKMYREYQIDFMKTLSRGAAEMRALSSRMSRLPKAVGGRQW